MIGVALAVYHEAPRMSRRRALGPSWSGRPCPSSGNPYDGRCESCARYMGRAVVWLLAEEAYRRAERRRPRPKP